MASHSKPINSVKAAGTAINALNKGSLGYNFDQTAANATCINIIGDYPWTTSKTKDRKDVPFIRLIEHRMEESLIKRQFAYYAKGVKSTVTDRAKGTKSNTLSVYDEIWPDNTTNFTYIFPYFNKTHYELNTPLWSKVDKPGEALKSAAGGSSSALDKAGFESLSKAIDLASAGADLAAATAELALGSVSPLVGTVDRPRIFTEHSERSITIQFPLYNTINAEDWTKNKDFFRRFATQNLFNKQDFITGLPPVWYRIYVPGQYYSHASCVTNFTVENLGNVRMDSNNQYIIPDAYQINITLTEMLMPSINQFQAAYTTGAGSGLNRVTTSTKSILSK